MDDFCAPYAFALSLESQCFGDLILSTLDSSLFVLIILLEMFMTKAKESKPIDPKLLSLMLTLILSYFISLSLVLFYLPMNEVSPAQVTKLVSQIFLWLIVANSYYNHFSHYEYALTPLKTLKIFVSCRIITVLYSIFLSFAIKERRDLTIMNTISNISIVLVVVFIFLVFQGSRRPRGESLLQEEVPRNSYERASIFSKLIMNWAYPLLKLGSTRTIEPTDIDEVRESETCKYQKTRLHSYIGEIYTTTDKYRLIKIMYKRYSIEIFIITAIGMVSALLDFTSPIFVGLMEAYLASSEPLWRGIALVFYLLLAKLLSCVVGNQFTMFTSLLSAHIKSALSSEIYGKLLRISQSSISKNSDDSMSYGKIINLIQVDLDGITSGIINSMDLLVLPFSWGIGFYLLFETIGWKGGLTGTGIIIVLLITNLTLTRLLNSRQKLLMEKKDVRMKRCNELLSNIRIFKIYNWENKLSERVLTAREQEMKQQKSVFSLNTFVIFMSWGAQNYLAVGVILTMVLTGVTLTPTNVFAGLSVIRVVRNSMYMLPNIVNTFIQTKISLTRIQDYLRSKDQGVYIQQTYSTRSIFLKNSSFAWEIPEVSEKGELVETKTSLKDINLEVFDGELIAVVGKVASGKSSLLQALIQNMHLVKSSEDSSVSIKGNIAFCSQEAWIQNKTIRDNILFGKELDEKMYWEVIRVCMLRSDLQILPGGDLTEIGERGINLSGGQKARVNIARAIYSEADIYLFDDPLAALDQYVGKTLFEECIFKHLKGKTRVIVTNNQQFLSHADRIVVLDQGKIVQQGTFDELISVSGYFKDEFMVDLKQTELSGTAPVESADKQEVKAKKLVESEERAIGSVKLSVYKTYYNYAGGMTVILLGLLTMSLWQADRMGTDIFLAEWTDESESEQRRNLMFNILVFTVGSMSINVFIFFRVLNTYIASLRASRVMFNTMLKSLIDASIPLFYDVNPMGRILNRFSKDQNAIDSGLPGSINFSLAQIFSVFMIVCFCIYTVPIVLVSLPVAAYLALRVQTFYLATARELTRIESMSRSPIVQHFSETLNGLSTIRAFGYQDRFISTYFSLIDKNVSIAFSKNGSYCWLAIALELISDLILAISAFFIIFYRDSMDAGLAGNCLVYIMMLPDGIYSTIFATSALENSMVSVERVHAMTSIDREDLRVRHKDSNLIERSWPSQGCIEFKQFSTRYRPDTEIVLKSITAVINPSEKIGIMGRTGSGKSSLVNSLFRVIEATAGRIIIDGIDIAEVGLDLLRQKLCVIPQDPALYQGKLRDNIDPLKMFTDEDIIEHVNLVQLSLTSEGLEMEVKENASNFSVGQKQLICIARAMLRKCKIIILDEATASIDFKTDAIIQEIIQERFRGCTVLTIAHRINTILHSDRIMVLDKGELVEFDTPENLKKMNGVFSSLAETH